MNKTYVLAVVSALLVIIGSIVYFSFTNQAAVPTSEITQAQKDMAVASSSTERLNSTASTTPVSTSTLKAILWPTKVTYRNGSNYGQMMTDGGSVYLRVRGPGDTNGKTIYYNLNSVLKETNHLVPEADPESFTIVGFCEDDSEDLTIIYPAYFTDNNSVYLSNKKIEKIDRASFQYLGTFRSPYLDAASTLSLAKDKNFVYSGCGKVLEGADPRTFTNFVDTNGNYTHYKDKNRVWYKRAILEGADAATFDIAWYPSTYPGTYNYGYAKDKNLVWFKDTKLQGADPGTFITLHSGYAKDKNKVWYMGVIVKDADSATFEITGGLDSNEELRAKDKYREYREGLDSNDRKFQG